MTATETWTVGRLLTWTTDYLRERGADSPRLDAEVLLAEARGCQRIELYTAFDQAATDEVRTAFRELVRRRAEGTPVAYLVGRREFYSLSLRVTPDVLIPRPETELLVVTLLDLVKVMPAERTFVTALDVGTGSGCIPIAALKHAPRLKFTAVDVSPAALDVAAKNAAQHQVADRATFLESDLLSAVPPGQFDFIVSNPPYVTTAEMASLPVDILKHEPHLALEGGASGTDIIARLIPQAAERLVPHGHLLMEISPMIEPAVRALLEADKRLERLPTIKDLSGHARVVHARRV